MSKKVMAPVQIVVDGDMSDNIASAAIDASFQDNIGLQIQWTSSDAVGVLAVEASVDGTTFYALDFDPALTQPSSNNGGYLVSLNQLPYSQYRVTYTSTSGEGTLQVWATSKEV